ncbi:MAG: nucleotidyltransferase family protein [bacterium]|nr:nucleotidyltransferase family protein [bacterium]
MSNVLSLDALRKRLRSLIPELSDKYQIESLALFGSYVRREQTADSDLDLLVTFHEPPGMFGFVQLENHLSDKLGVKVDLVMKSALKPRIGERILLEAEPV